MNRPWPFRALLTANAVSIAGSSMTMLALPWFVLATTGSPSRTGVVAACEGVSIGLSSALSSPLVDRLGARRTAILSDCLSGVGVALVPLLQAAGVLQFWQLCALVFGVGLVRAPGDTARYVLSPRLVELAGIRMERAMGMYDGVSRGARMLGAPLAGVMVALIGAANVLLLDAVTFGVSALLVASAVPKLVAARNPGSYFGSLGSGLRFLRADRLLLAIVVMVCVTNLLDAAWSSVLLPVYGREVLDSSVAVGAMIGVFGLGALTGTVIYGSVGHRIRRWPLYTTVFLVCGSPRLFGLAFDLPLGGLLVLAIVTGLACGCINPVLTVVELERVPEQQRASVYGVGAAGALAGVPLGALVAGLMVERVGVHTALLATGVLYLLTTLAPVIWRSTWRQMDPVPVQERDATMAA